MKHITNFLEDLQYHKNYSEKTIVSYRRDLEQLQRFLKNVNISSCTEKNISLWVKELHSQGISEKTIQRKLSSLRSFFNFLIETKIISSNPTVNIKAPKGRKPLPKTVSVDELAFLLDITPASDIEKRDIAIFDMIYSCGIRLNELETLHLEQINFSTKSIRVLGKGKKERLCYFGDKTLRNLNQWLNIRDSYTPKTTHLFISQKGDNLSGRSIQKRLEIFSKKHASKHLHPHMLRHSFANHLLESSKDLLAVKNLLGHANIASTQIYTHLNFQQLAETFDQSHPRAKKKKP